MEEIIEKLEVIGSILKMSKSEFVIIIKVNMFRSFCRSFLPWR